MSRRALIVGNWKMELSHKASLEVAASLKKQLAAVKVDADVVICPSFTVLGAIQELFAHTEKVMLGAQNVHWEKKGPWTGEVSVLQLASLVKWCIVGHSEQRALSGETDEQVCRKANVLLEHGLTPIVCIGESAAERAAEVTVAKITGQVETLLASLNRTTIRQIVIAYEPIWAIGSGIMPEPADVAGLLLLIRKLITARFGAQAEHVPIIYGGSVKPDSVAAFVAEPGVDGVLVGNASVHPLDFIAIINTVQQVIAEKGTLFEADSRVTQ